MSHDKQHAIGSTGDHSSSTLALLNALISDSLINPMRHYPADSLEIPNNSDWTVNALAGVGADTNNAGLGVRRFDDTTEEGVGLKVYVPRGATNVKIYLVSRAETAAASNLNVVPSIYGRRILNGAAVGSWSSRTNMTTITMHTSQEYFVYDSQSIALTTLNWVVEQIGILELTRNTGSGSDTLVGDWTLSDIILEFT